MQVAINDCSVSRSVIPQCNQDSDRMHVQLGCTFTTCCSQGDRGSQGEEETQQQPWRACAGRPHLLQQHRDDLPSGGLVHSSEALQGCRLLKCFGSLS